ncbi:MAG: hypothetical protein FP815_09245 [Desulfobulbaceae bacterium]|nr:hypothetical protein [Desulfobulbaceae bacterium]
MQKKSVAVRVIIDIALVVGSSFMALAAVEILLPNLHIQGIERHVYQYRRPIVQYLYGQYHPVLGNTLLPDLQGVHVEYRDYLNYTFSTNNNGFRGLDWDFSPERKNIVVLGDSFAFGWGVEEGETFSSLLEMRLRQIDPAIQVLNMAQSGYSLDQVLNTYELYGKQFDPIFIIYLYCYNDPIDPPPFVNGEFGAEIFRAKISRDAWDEESKLNNINYWRFERFWKGSYLFAFYDNYLLPFFADKQNPQIRRARKARLRFCYDNLSPPNPPTSPVPRATIQQQYVWYGLAKLYKDSKDRPLLLMDTSDKVFIHMEDSSDSDRWLLRDFSVLYKNVFFLDFESEVRRRNDGISKFLNVDDHWNAAGHLLAAEMLGSVIDQNLELLGIKKRP